VSSGKPNQVSKFLATVPAFCSHCITLWAQASAALHKIEVMSFVMQANISTGVEKQLHSLRMPLGNCCTDRGAKDFAGEAHVSARSR
jgi:hypothetical protein